MVQIFYSAKEGEQLRCIATDLKSCLDRLQSALFRFSLPSHIDSIRKTHFQSLTQTCANSMSHTRSVTRDLFIDILKSRHRHHAWAM